MASQRMEDFEIASQQVSTYQAFSDEVTNVAFGKWQAGRIYPLDPECLYRSMR